MIEDKLMLRETLYLYTFQEAPLRSFIFKHFPNQAINLYVFLLETRFNRSDISLVYLLLFTKCLCAGVWAWALLPCPTQWALTLSL